MNTVDEALSDVDRAFRHLEFAIKLMCYCELDHLDRRRFDTDVAILLERENVSFPAGTFQSLQAVVSAAQALVGVCFGISATVLDAAFEAASIPRRPQSRTSADELRSLVYMIRCAFAHNPAFPCWEARGQDFSRTMTVQLNGGELLRIDLASLHCKPFEYEHIGGFANWYKVRAAAQEIILPPNSSSSRRVSA